MKNRIKKTIKNTIAIFCLGIFLYILYLFHISVPCFFKLATHLNCPGCGVSRMCISLTHGHVRSAFYYNQLLIFLFPVAVPYYIFFQIRYIRTGQTQPAAIETKIITFIVILLIVYGIIRNMPFWPYPLL